MKIEEVRRRRLRRETANTAGAENPDITPEQLDAIVDKVFSVGALRVKELQELGAVRHLRDGTYYIEYVSTGQYADFAAQANYDYLHKKYPFLHKVSEGLGFDEDYAADSNGSLADYLGAISIADWESFTEDMSSLEDYPLLDEERAMELEMQEVERWMTEDGGPDLIREMVENATNAYDAYRLSKVPLDKVFDWMRESGNYPEAQGEGTVWLNMKRIAKQASTREWFLEEMPEDEAGWLNVKSEVFNEVAEKFDAMLKRMADEDEQVSRVYTKLDADGLWQLFLAAFPDEPRHAGDPYWYMDNPRWYRENEPSWQVGYYDEIGGWARGYHEALEHLYASEWFWSLVRNWNFVPKDHPEFRFEALDTKSDSDPDPDPDDPEVFIRDYVNDGRGIREKLLYEDDRIVVMEPQNRVALNYHLNKAGMVGITDSQWHDSFQYAAVFVVQAKMPPDFTKKRELAVIYGGHRLHVWNPELTLNALLKESTYGPSIRKALVRFFRTRVNDNSDYAPMLLQVGGIGEVRRALPARELMMSALGVTLGLYYVDHKKYRLAANAFNRPVSTITPKGVWLLYTEPEDLAPVFSDESTAQTILSDEYTDWWYVFNEAVDASDVIPFLSQDAINHIRKVMVNRRVYFPDEDQWIVLTTPILNEYDDKTILSWVTDPVQEDEDAGVWDDIIEALKQTGRELLEQATRDNMYKTCVNSAVRAIGGTQHKWGVHPTKKTKSGANVDVFEVFVPWSTIRSYADDRTEDNTEYVGTLEDLVVQSNLKSEEIRGDYADWRDVDKASAKEQMDRIYELEPVDEPVDPNQPDLPLSENDEDEQVRRLLQQYGVDEPDYDLEKAEKEADARGHTQARAKETARAYLKSWKRPHMEARDSYPPEFVRQVNAITFEAYGRHVEPTLSLEPREDGQKLYVEIDPPKNDAVTESEVLAKIHGAATHAFREFDLCESYLAENSEKVGFCFILKPI